MKKLSALLLVIGVCLSFNANAWFFFFLPGSATRAIGDAITGAKGDICVKDTYKEGDVINSPTTSNTGKILSLSGTSSMCKNPALPIRAEVEFTFNHNSKAGIDIPADYEAEPVKDLERFNGKLLLAKSKTVSEKAIFISSMAKKPNFDIDVMANNFERSQINQLKDASTKNSERLKINGLNAVSFEVAGTIKGTFGKDMTYFITLIDAGDEVLYISEWCPTNIFPETKSEFVSIINSIKGLEGESIVDGIKTTVTKQTMPARADPKPSAIAPVASPTSSNPSTGPADKLETLNGLLKRGLITQKDYDSKKAEILKSM